MQNPAFTDPTLSVFAERPNFKPFLYPQVADYKRAIQHSYWLHSEWNFISDNQDFRTKLSEEEKEVVTRTLLAISQVEVAVKDFWPSIGKTFPQAEFKQVGTCFGDCEVRHADAYSHLLEVLDLNDRFLGVLDVEPIRRRKNLLDSSMVPTGDIGAGKIYPLVLFSQFVENVSLFSQFVVIKSFNYHKNLMKDIDNVVQSTQKEEVVHAKFGEYLVNLVRSQFPHTFTPEFEESLRGPMLEVLEAEYGIIDWIMCDGDLPHLTRAQLKNYIAHRLNDGLRGIGFSPIVEEDPLLLSQLSWFDIEILSETSTDFFNKKPTTYSKRTMSVNPDDLF